jgi:enterochelin esterase-like enzyme
MGRSLSLQAWVIGTLVTSACSSGGSNSGAAGTGGQTGPGNAVATGANTTAAASSSGGGGSGATSGTGSTSGGTGTGGGTGTAASSATGGGVGDAGTAQTAADASSSASASDGGGGANVGVLGPDGGDDDTDTSVGDGEFMVGPTYTPSPYLTLDPGAPAGFTTSFTMSSADSKIYNGSYFTPPITFTRQIQVWVPAQYVDGTESPFMVTSDGYYGSIQTVVQDLAGSPPPNHVPPLVVIGIQNGPNVYPNSERSYEYDTVSSAYWEFVTTEVLPAVLSNAALKAKYPNFALTSDPNGRGGYGCSSGGPAVMGLAWFGDFNRVFSFSGSYVAIQKTAAYPEGAWEYPSLITAAPLRPDLRVFLEVGQNDNGSTTPATSDSNWVIANQNMAAALMTKGNHYRFIYALGAGHCDHNARNEVMPAGLIWLWENYQGN